MSFMDFITQFHFLRPLWLLALLLVPLLWWYSQKTQAFSGSDWSKAIQPELLKHLMVGKSTASTSTNSWVWILLSIIFIVIGLSGPSWQKKPEPLHQQTDNLAVVLDLSLSMLASDQKPDRLTRAKHKLRDLLDQRKEGTTALIVYSGDSYVVTPLTDDINTLKSMLPALDPFIMPVMGSRPDLAIEKAIDVLKNGGATQGKILLITDGIEKNNLGEIKALLKSTNYPLSVLAVGTEQGGPINIPQQGYLKDKGSVIIPKTDFDRLNQLATENDGIMEAISLSDSDINNLNAITAANSMSTEESTDDGRSINNGLYDQWHDEGYWLALLLIPLVLIGHRKGAFSLVLVLTFTFQPNEAMAFEWKDLWKTPDQQAMALVDKDPAKAAELFQNNQWKGATQFKAKNFEAAQQSFDSGDTVTDLYNGATALAQQQKFEEAVSAYEKVLEKDPEFKDAALNKALIEKFLEEQEKQEQQSQDKSSDDSESDQSKQEQSDSQDSKDSQNDQQSENQEQSDQQQNSDQQNQSEQSDSEQSDQETQQDQAQQSDKKDEKKQQEQQASASEQSDQEAQTQKQEQENKEQQAKAQEVDELTDEETQAFEQWMRRVPDDPGGLLRRKFAQQYQQKQYENRRRPQRQEEGQPIW